VSCEDDLPKMNNGASAPAKPSRFPLLNEFDLQSVFPRSERVTEVFHDLFRKTLPTGATLRKAGWRPTGLQSINKTRQ